VLKFGNLAIVEAVAMAGEACSQKVVTSTG
jgi:hypothetical protein